MKKELVCFFQGTKNPKQNTNKLTESGEAYFQIVSKAT